MYAYIFPIYYYHGADHVHACKSYHIVYVVGF